jgi:6-pyruvoyltetrahydropterin/6-carboxytetrahydropterin synthase
VQITVEGAQLDSIGLLCDFLHLKQIIRGIVQGLDHQFLNDLPAFSRVNPSAENLAKHFYEEASKQVAALPASARITGITVWETDVTSATYTPE